MSFSYLETLLSEKLCPFPLSEDARRLVNLLIASSREGQIALPAPPNTSGLEELKRNLPPTLVFENDRLYLQKHYYYEKTVKTHLERLTSIDVTPIPLPDTTRLNTQQLEAVRKALQFPVTFITGGPGTGKTHTAATIIEAFLNLGKTHVILTAPTGKAAAHLAKKISHPDIRSGTLHSFLKGEDPILLADLILVDESSMIGAALFARFLSAIPDKTCIVFLGDQNQLPPVDAGRLFADCIDTQASQYITSLSFCHRTDNQEILTLATAILEKNIEKIPLLPLDFSAIEKTLPLFPQATSQPPTEEELIPYTASFAILSCIRKGPFGADAINAHLFHLFSQQKGWLAVPILITKNDPALDLYNGDTGFLIKHLNSAERNYAFFPSTHKTIPEAALPPFEYAYALSVHKSQGSEYDKVLVLIPEGSERFGKEILYTAVTRAKKEVTLLGNPMTLRSLL